MAAACPGSSPWFGSCIRSFPCRCKSHCRRPAFACSPFHRSLSTEKRGVKRGCSRGFLWPPQKAPTLHTEVTLLLEALFIDLLKPSSQATAGSVRHSPNWGSPRQASHTPSLSGAPREGQRYSYAIKLPLPRPLRPCQ